MKKKVIIIFLIQILIIFSGILLIALAINKSWKKEFDRFDYDKAKKTAIKYLNKNEEQFKTIVDELYENKSSIENPLENIIHARYYYDDNFNFKNDEEYVKLDIDAQEMLGGQYYGLIYAKNNEEELIKNKELHGNNIFIRQKIKDNWYFYYNDYDGKVNINKIQTKK